MFRLRSIASVATIRHSARSGVSQIPSSAATTSGFFTNPTIAPLPVPSSPSPSIFSIHRSPLHISSHRLARASGDAEGVGKSAPIEDDHDDPPGEDREDDRSDRNEIKSIERSLGIGGQMSKADRMAARMKRARANKAQQEESRHSKARVEKLKEKARKMAQLKVQQATDLESESDLLIENEDDKKIENVQLDKNLQKVLNQQLATLIPKTEPGKKKSPAQIAAEAKLAAEAKAKLLAEQAIVRVNDKITAKQMILIDNDGKKLGLFSRGDAFKKAKELDLDLLQVSPSHAPMTVCKLLNYNVYRFEQDRRERLDKKAKRAINRDLKTVMIKGKIASGDLQTKIKRMSEFLNKNHPVKLTFYSGRQTPDPLIFMPMFETVVDKLQLDGSIEPNSLQASRPYLTFSPLNDKRRALMYPKLTDEQKKAFGVYLDKETGQWRQRGRKTEEEKALEEEEDEDENDIDEDDDLDEDIDDDEQEALKSAPSDAAANLNPAPTSTPPSTESADAPSTPAATTSNGKKQKEKHKKSKPTYVTGPALFSRAALQNIKKEAEAGQK